MLKAVLFSVVAAYFAMRYHSLLDISREVEPTADCYLLGKGEIRATEDLVLWKAGILIGGVGDTLKCVQDSPESLPNGYLIAVDARSGDLKAVKVKTEGMPSNMSFRPHGIYFSKDTNRLYAVNHGGVTNVGTRVEVFSVKEGKDGLPEFEWLMAVGDNHRFGNVVLNSVVEVSPTELYVTQWQNTPVPDKGTKNPITWEEKLGRLFHTGVEFLATVGNTGVHYCKFDVEKGTNECDWALHGFVHANGITTNANKSIVWVSDPLRKELRAFDRNATDGSLTENMEKRILVPHAVDNAHFDEESGEIWMGTMLRVYEPVLRMLHLKEVQVSGSFLVARPNTHGQGFVLRNDLESDGTILDWISACARVSHDHEHWSVCGSPVSEGLLVCPSP